MDITQETMRAIGELGQSVKDLTGSNEAAANTLSNLEARARETGEQLSNISDKSGRLNKDGFDALQKAMGKAGKDYSKQLTLIYKNTDSVISKINDSFGNFAKRIPVIGKTLERGFADVLNRMKGRIDKVLLFSGRMGAGVGAVGGLLGAAGVAAVALLGRQFNQIEKSSIAVAKATGLSGANLKAVTTSMVAAQNASYAMGISMDETANASAALVTTLGNFRKITPELIQQTSMLAKFTGASAEEAGKFVGTLSKGFGKSADDIDTFVNGIASFATREGVNARKVLGDIVSDTNLMSIYMSRGEDALKRAAVQAAKMGMSLSETQGVSEAFLDLEGGAELVGQINLRTGASLNALEMFNLAAKNDTVAIMNRINSAFSTPQGIRFIEDAPGLAKQFAGQFGMNLKQLRIAAGLDRDRSKILTADEQTQKNISELLEAQQTTFERIKNTVLETILPPFNKVAEKLGQFVGGLGKGAIQGAVQAAAVLGGAALGALLLRGTRLNPMFVQSVGVGVGGGGGAGGGVPYEPRGSSGGTRGSRLGNFARNLAGRGGKLGRIAGMLGTGIKFGATAGKAMLKTLPFLGAAIAAYQAFTMFQDGNYLGAGLTALGGLASFIPGLGTGAAIALGGAGQATQLFGAAAKGAVVSSPRLFMVGEENRTEAIIPTERIRKGLPIDAGVARELGSIGVPGYMTGLGSMTGRRSSRAKREQIRSSQATVQQGAQSDPAVIRERELAFERAAQRERDEQRRMMQNIEQKTLQILEEEKKAASNISTSHGKFSRGVSLFQRIQRAAGQYTRKTFNRFADNLRKNNGDLREALKDTWAQTVGDMRDLQARLIGKLENFIGKLADKAVNFGLDLIDKGINKTMDFLKIGNEANRQQFDQAVRGEFRVSGADTVVNPRMTGGDSTIGQRASFGFAEGRDGFALNKNAGFIERGAFKVGETFAKIETFLGPYAEKFKQIGGQIDAASVSMVASGNLAGAATHLVKRQLIEDALTGSAGMGGITLDGPQSSLLAGTGALAQGDYTGAAKAVGMDIGRKGITTGVNKILGTGAAKSGMLKGLSAGGGVAAAGLGAFEGIMAGDFKAAARGGLEGAVGYALGGVLSGVAGPVLGPMLGSIAAGPVTDGLVTTGKELAAGAKNLAGGVGKIFEGDFKGGLGSLAKGGGQILLSGFKGVGSVIKGIGGIFGFGKPKVGKERNKFLNRVMKALAAGDKLVGPGGKIRGNKKAQEELIKATKWGENGPEQKLMNEMVAQVMHIAGVPQDIATAFIYAALGADMNKETLEHIDNEMGTGFGKADLTHQFDLSTERGRKDALKFADRDRLDRTLGVAEQAEKTQAEQRAAQRKQNAALVRQEIARLAADGLTLEEVRQVQAMTGGAGLATLGSTERGSINRGVDVSTGNVYLDGVIVGTLVQQDADDLRADGLPSSNQRDGNSRDVFE